MAFMPGLLFNTLEAVLGNTRKNKRIGEKKSLRVFLVSAI
jgi:hypothetical protein